MRMWSKADDVIGKNRGEAEAKGMAGNRKEERVEE